MSSPSRPPLPYDFLPPVPSFDLRSDDVADGQMMSGNQVFDGFGMTGGNISPSLYWSGFPDETKGFAVTCYDPDAPTGSGFWHWVVVGIPADVTELPQGGELPSGAFCVRNDYGENAYGGPAPPEGDRDHRYFFAVHALDSDDLGLDESASPAYVGFNLTFHVLARAVAVPTYKV